jgi:SRSO17 transposase
MPNIKTTIDEWEVKDLEDNSKISVLVLHNTEMGNQSVPGVQVMCAGMIVNYEPLHVERWAYAAKKAQQTAYLITDSSWTVYEDTYIKHYLVTGNPLKAKIEVKVRSKDEPVIKEYDLPFAV